jgi:hypothetical protein
LETIQESIPDKSVTVEPLVATAIKPGAAPLPARLSLPPKGSCWYCEKPLDSVRRFCGKSCSDAFDEEAEFNRGA